MNWRLEVHQVAESDIASAASWYAQQQPGLETRFIEEVKACCAFILTNPNGPAKAGGHYRQFRLETFPFHVVYFIIDDLVLVMRVYHMSRDHRRKLPRGKRSR
jgi:plasmid stabilization system protein ParE